MNGPVLNKEREHSTPITTIRIIDAEAAATACNRHHPTIGTGPSCQSIDAVLFSPGLALFLSDKIHEK
jgi:hypothetical protein